MAEQFAFQQLGGQGRAVDGHEFVFRPAGKRVDGLGHQLLPRAALPFNQDSCPAGSHLADDGKDMLHGGGPAQQFLKAGIRLDAGGEFLVGRFQVPGMERPLEHQLHGVQVQGLGDEVICTLLHGSHGGVHGPVGGHHDAFGRLGQGGSGFQHVHAAFTAQAQVRQDQVRGFLLQEGDGLGEIGGGVHFIVILKAHAQGVPRGFLIIYDQQDGHFHDGTEEGRSLMVRSTRGRKTVMVVPWPGWLARVMEPPRSFTMRRTMSRPRPEPVDLVVRKGS